MHALLHQSLLHATPAKLFVFLPQAREVCCETCVVEEAIFLQLLDHRADLLFARVARFHAGPQLAL